MSQRTGIRVHIIRLSLKCNLNYLTVKQNTIIYIKKKERIIFSSRKVSKNEENFRIISLMSIRFY